MFKFVAVFASCSRNPSPLIILLIILLKLMSLNLTVKDYMAIRTIVNILKDSQYNFIALSYLGEKKCLKAGFELFKNIHLASKLSTRLVGF